MGHLQSWSQVRIETGDERPGKQSGAVTCNLGRRCGLKPENNHHGGEHLLVTCNLGRRCGLKHRQPAARRRAAGHLQSWSQVRIETVARLASPRAGARHLQSWSQVRIETISALAPTSTNSCHLRFWPQVRIERRGLNIIALYSPNA